MGTIDANTDVGIFGHADERLQKSISGEPMEIGYRQDVKKGQAWIRSSVSGELKDYEIEIQRVDYNPIHQNKGLVIQVVDEELLKLTGGIVQGMVVRYNRDNTGNPLFYKVFRCLPLFSLTSR